MQTTTTTAQVKYPDLLSAILSAKGNMTDVKFAELLGISQAHWSRISNGTRSPGANLLCNICQAIPSIMPWVMLYMAGELPFIKGEPCLEMQPSSMRS